MQQNTVSGCSDLGKGIRRASLGGGCPRYNSLTLEFSCQAEFRMHTSLFHAPSSSKTLEAGTAQMNSSSICHSLAPTASLGENLSELQLGISYSVLPPRQRTGFQMNNNVFVQ